MKLLIMALVVAMANADVSHLGDTAAQITRYSVDVNPDSYKYEYETSNGIAAQESGALTNSAEYPAIAAQGSFQYTSPEGSPVQLSYVADENGFQPQGSHLPTPPPVPEYVLRSIKYIEQYAPRV